MTDPVFFVRPAPMSIAEIAALTGAEAPPEADLGRAISDVAPLDQARPDHVTFFDSARFMRALAETKAGACFCMKRHFAGVPNGTVALVTSNPRRAFAQVANHLYPAAVRPVPISGERGVSAAAHVHPEAAIEADVTVEPFTVVGPGAEIGRGSHIGPGSVIGPGVRIGRDVIVEANVTITHALVGNRVVLHPGVRVGQDGFGYVPGAAGHLKIAQIGRVIIQDDVEIGANTAIDRGGTRDTVIGEGSKIDNQVQIAHNVVIGRHCLIAGQVGISGSVTIGDFVMIGGNAGIRDNVTIGHGARIAAMSGIHTDVPAGEAWAGVPAQPIKGFQRQLRALKRLETRSGPPAGEEGGPVQ